MQILKFNNINELSKEAASYIIKIAKKYILKKGFVTIALSGGNSPGKVYLKLSDIGKKEGLDWQRVFIFWGDERYVHYTNKESNYHMAYKNLLSKVPIPEANIFRIPTEISPVDKSAEVYESIMKNFFIKTGQMNKKGKFPIFDIILLGMGEDGHIASLFPDTNALNEKRKWVVSVRGNEKLKIRDRITITFPVINTARHIIFIISGEKKAKALHAVINRKNFEHYPISKVKIGNKVKWFIDKNIFK